MEQDPDRPQEKPDPVVDQTARVTEARPMDESRADEVGEELSRRWPDVAERLDGDADEPTDVRGWKQVVDELVEAGEERTADEIDALIDRADRSYPSLLGLRLTPDEQRLAFDPGQYVRISFEEEEPRVYSLASSPNEDELELCITRVPGGELTPSLLDGAKRGDDLFVRGPFGDELSLLDESDRDMVFVATGTGVAPLRSMIRYTFEEGLDSHDGENRDVWLFLGASWRDDLPYHAEFEELSREHENFHYVPTLSQERLLTDWVGETAYVQQTLVKYLAEGVDRERVPEELHGHLDSEARYDIDARLDPENAELYICGVGRMCESVTDVTERLGLPERVSKVESYG
ncbi:CDP-4-dehydro-6-deoxyglucose reductase [Halogranum rubrum]|uniref:CDP-4-dehydro-6-deoxyglucose reductase n=1 Tax=Halogranum rubrum TaxID=553466 RepID=A0A1I4CEQ2_9EURY|nr:FAD-binding oxidoreductase [Halogranum rubrum]SFK78626.1 CDP-4-dehydro-6-deoxyglucose reductase [Halogranum rubrum]